MNFKTRLSYNNRILFVYDNGEIKQTAFVEVAYYGDNYILAKGAEDTFYSLLDLDGNMAAGHNVVHRFQNGLLLTYNFFSKDYVSSDKCRYSINYNLYNVLNFATGKSFTVNIIQSDNLLRKPAQDSLQDRPSKTVIKHFLNKPVYQFRDLIFSEILDNQFMITGTILNIHPNMLKQGNSFEMVQGRRIWSVVDVFEQKNLKEVTEHEGAVVANVTFNEAQAELSAIIGMPEEPFKEDFANIADFKDANAEFHMYTTWKKKNKWQSMFSNMLAFNNN